MLFRCGSVSTWHSQRDGWADAALSPDGCTEAILAARDIPVSLIVQLVRAGLATTKAERVVAGRLTIEVTKIWLTEAGRQALADTGDRRSMKVAK